MDKTKIGIVLVGIAIIAVIGYALFTQLNRNSKNAPQSNSLKVSETLYSLTQKKGNVMCVWEKTEAETVTKNTIYISGEKFAMDTQTIANNTAIITHLLGDGKKIYTWTDSTEIPGMIMTYDNLQNPKPGTQHGLIYQKNDYTCTDWTPEAIKFNLPTNITFQ